MRHGHDRQGKFDRDRGTKTVQFGFWPGPSRTTYAQADQAMFHQKTKREIPLMNPLHRGAPVLSRMHTAAVSVLMLLSIARPAAAEVALGPVTVGAGMQASFFDCDKSCIYSPATINTAAGDSSVAGFALNDIRLYVNGNVTNQIKIMFNTEYTGSGSGPGADKLEVLDAVGRFEFSDYLNIWAGRFLEPSDRANMYGPFYANDWTPFADGVADFYPGIENGRDNGLMYWGQFGILKAALGVFDGESTNSVVADKSKLLYAGRLMLDFWDPEAGYYLNSTYYGDKDLLAVGLAAQSQNSKNTESLDALLDKKLPNLGVLTVEAEYLHDNGLSGTTSSKGWFGLGAYLFPQVVGIGKFQVLAKYSQKTVDAGFDETIVNGFISTTPVAANKIKTLEINANYLIKPYNARVGFYYLHQKQQLNDYYYTPLAPAIGPTSAHEIGLKLQLQM